MNSEMEKLRCAIVRGGTSKGVFIMKNELPKDPVLRDQTILAIYGSPDIRQIDGLGGADSLTSKLAIISPATKDWADVDYTFGQVSITDAFVDYGGNCGNISAAVGGFAIDMGLVEPIEPTTTVKIHMTNTGKMLTAEVPVKNGKAAVEGDYEIDGCPGTGAKITLDWSEAVGGSTGKLLPTGNAKDIIEAGGKNYTVSIVDAGNIVIFVRAEEMGLVGTETPDIIDANIPLNELIEEIRGKVCQKLGIVKNWQDAKKTTPYQPFFAMVSPATDYKCFNGNEVKISDVDFVSRLLFMLKMHKTYPVTGTVATGAVARIKNSVVYDLMNEQAKKEKIVRIGHPAGVIAVEATAEYSGADTIMTKIGVYRTARMIMEGYVYVRKSLFEK